MKKRRLFSAFTSALLLSSLLLHSFPVLTAAAGILPGDVNGDGAVTFTDAVIYQGWMIGDDNVEILAPQNADVNGDGKVNAIDLTLVKQMLISGKQTAPPDSPVLTDSKIYQKAALTDTQIGAVVYEGILPEGWTAQIESSWWNVNPDPGLETVTFISPDGKARISISSPQTYEQATDRGFGMDLSNFITLAPYMNASQFIDYYMQNTYPDAEFIQNMEVTAEQKADIDSYTEYYALNGINTAIQYSRYAINSYGAEGTAARQQFRIGDGFGEFSCAIAAYEYSYTKIILDVTETWWRIVNSVAYTADDQESFERYYDDYEIIVANGHFTAAFFSALAYMQNQILNMMIEFRTEQALAELAGSYSSSGTEITNSDMETQEKVMQAWDDYIKDDNAYSLNDGSVLKVPTSIDTVAQNGDSLYFGTPGSVPLGYDILTPN